MTKDNIVHIQWIFDGDIYNNNPGNGSLTELYILVFEKITLSENTKLPLF